MLTHSPLFLESLKKKKKEQEQKAATTITGKETSSSAGNRVPLSQCTCSVPVHRRTCFYVAITVTATESLQSCVCDPIPGILQARTLEWVAISFSNA